MLIVGLGNPGKEYEKTFHNMGFMVVEKLAKEMGKRIIKGECSSLTAVKSVGKENIILAKPLTYMNLSGQAISSLMKKYNQKDSDLIVIYDDIDIDRFSVRIREKGSGGTHNGMKNIIAVNNTQNFIRVRMGVGRNDYDLKDYVLSKIKKEDYATFEEVTDKVVALLIDYINNRDFERLLREGNGIK